MEADRLDGLFAACADAGDDVVRVLADGAARRRRGVGESISDEFAMEADRLDGLLAACADAGDDVVRVLDAALRVADEACASWSATRSPSARIASTVCAPLAVARLTTSFE